MIYKVLKVSQVHQGQMWVKHQSEAEVRSAAQWVLDNQVSYLSTVHGPATRVMPCTRQLASWRQQHGCVGHTSVVACWTVLSTPPQDSDVASPDLLALTNFEQQNS